MRSVRFFVLPLALLCAAPELGKCQAVMPFSGPAPAESAPCPNYGTNVSSASAARCSALDRSKHFLDGGNRLYAVIGSMGGHDDAFNARKGLPASFEGGVLYGGLLSLKPRSFNLYETTASLMDYHTAQRNLMYMNSTRISLTHLPSPRTVLSLDADNLFGNDAIRVVGLSGTNGSAEDITYGIHPGRILNNQVTGRISRESTETRWWSASVRNTFRYFIDDNTRVDTVHGRAELHYQPSSRAGAGLFEETSIQTGIIDCTSQSVGVMYERRLSRTMAIEGAGGPAIGTKGCVTRISANLYGGFSLQARSSSHLWISASRRNNDSNYGPLTYENNVQSGIVQRFGLSSWLRARGGWIGGTVPYKTAPFSGTYVSSTFGHTLPGGFTAAFSFQHFEWNGMSSIAPSRSLFTGTLYWNPSRAESDAGRGPIAH